MVLNACRPGFQPNNNSSSSFGNDYDVAAPSHFHSPQNINTSVPPPPVFFTLPRPSSGQHYLNLRYSYVFFCIAVFVLCGHLAIFSW